MHDEQIRTEFSTWARELQATAPPPLAALRRRTRRRTARRAVIAGVAAAAAVVAFITLPRPGSAPVQSGLVHGAPPYAVELTHGGAQASVLDMATGTVHGQQSAPGGGRFTWIAAEGDDRRFVLVDQTRNFTNRFYLLRLNGAGQPVRLSALPVPPVRAFEVLGLAVSADGSELAVAWQNAPGIRPSDGMEIANLATGARHASSWASSAAFSLSWGGNRMLAFDWQSPNEQPRSGIRVLDTGRYGANPQHSRLVVPQTLRAGPLSSPSNPVLSQDGSVLFASLATGPHGTQTAIARFSAASGRLQAVLTRPAGTGSAGQYCGVLWASPDGHHLLTQCGTAQGAVTGDRYTPIRLPWLLPASPVGPGNTFAW